MSISCDFRGRNERKHKQPVSGERKDLLQDIPGLESPYFSQLMHGLMSHRAESCQFPTAEW